jgi:hypothetical protein
MAQVCGIEVDHNYMPPSASVERMTTTETYEIPVRLDFDSRAKVFSAAMAQLDGAAT